MNLRFWCLDRPGWGLMHNERHLDTMKEKLQGRMWHHGELDEPEANDQGSACTARSNRGRLAGECFLLGKWIPIAHRRLVGNLCPNIYEYKTPVLKWSLCSFPSDASEEIAVPGAGGWTAVVHAVQFPAGLRRRPGFTFPFSPRFIWSVFLIQRDQLRNSVVLNIDQLNVLHRQKFNKIEKYVRTVHSWSISAYIAS